MPHWQPRRLLALASSHGVGSGRVSLDGPGQPAGSREPGCRHRPEPADGGAAQRAVSLPPTVSVGNGPDGLAFDPATHTLYTSNQNANSVSVINTATCNAAHTRGCRQRVHSVSLPAGASPQGIAMDTVTGTIYVANIGGNTISVINARTCNAANFSGCRQTPASIKDPGGPIALAVDQATDTVYVANIGDNFSGTEPHRFGDQRGHLQRPPALRLRADAADSQSRGAARTASPSTRPPTPSTWSITAPPTTATPSR